MSETVLRILRQVQLDLDENDTSRDAELRALDPDVAFRLVCQWELGSRSWAYTVTSWLEGCGYEVKPKKK